MTAELKAALNPASRLHAIPRAEPQRMTPGQRLLTLEDVADLLGVSKAWVRDHATRRSPRIPVIRFGDRRAVLRFRLQDIEQFISSHLSGDGV